MSRRRELLKLLGLVPLSAAIPAWSADERKIPRIGFLASGNLEGTPQFDAFLLGLREMGYVEGKTIRIEKRWIDRDLQRLPALARELAQLPVDLIVAWSSPAVAAAKQSSSGVPVVMIAVSDPVGQGLVDSLARPGGYLTGLSNMLRGTIGKNVEMMVKIVPDARRLAVIRNPSNPGHGLVLQEAEVAAREHGVELAVVDLRIPEDVEPTFEVITRLHVAGVVIFGDPIAVQKRQRIAELATRARLPSTTIFRQYPEAGGLMSYGLNSTDQFRRSAYFVDKILKGARPADLPIEQPTTFELVVNQKTAKAIGLQVPESVLLRADRVIE